MEKTQLDLLFEAIRCYGGAEAEQYARQHTEFDEFISYVSQMFSWGDSPQGFDFWGKIHTKACHYCKMSPRDRLAERIEHECSEPHLAEYVRRHGEFSFSDRLTEQFAFTCTPYETAFFYIARKFGELPPLPDEPAPTAEPEESVEPELWWQKRDREAREQRDRIIALRNAIRGIHGL